MLGKLKIPNEELELLRELQINEEHKKDYIKVTTLIMLNIGFSAEQTGNSLGIDASTVRRYCKRYIELGLDRYLESNYKINSNKLTEEQRELLKLELTINLYKSSNAICSYIEQEFNVYYTAEGLVPLLHRLGFSYKKTKQEPCNYL